MIPTEYFNRIVTGDARELAKRIPDESIDLIFTDPVYDRIDDYRWLAETAARVLKIGGQCLTWTGTSMLNTVLDAMQQLNYAWLFVLRRIGGSNFGRNGKLMSKFEICLWHGKGEISPNKIVWDFQQSHQWPRFHSLGWDKPTAPIERWLDAFSQPGDIVLDPFTGGGTVPAVCKMLGRNYVAFEIDPDVAEAARERVQNTKPPLFVLEPEQTEMQLA